MTKRVVDEDIIRFLFADSIRNELLKEHGVLLGGKNLTHQLGFPTSSAFRKAKSRGVLPVQVFELENKRGCFALTDDLAIWLSDQRVQQFTLIEEGNKENKS